MRQFFLFTLFSALLLVSEAQETRVFPTHWWVGMKNPNLQLIIKGNLIGKQTRVNVRYPGVKLTKAFCPENPNYLFLDIVIGASAKPGELQILCEDPISKVSTVVKYQLLARNHADAAFRNQGVTAKDLIYLIMPDRFANGDLSNDVVKSYRDTLCERDNKFSRHGGDFKGVLDHLDYLNQLGVTSIWLTPVIENDMPRMHEWGNSVAGYHGYWFTDHYAIDKRFGGDKGYRNFCETLHRNGMKVIQDAVYNHVGNSHIFFLDPPMKDWFNNSQGTSQPNHREEVFFDPYVAEKDKRNMLDGWFTPHLPDLNQRNPYLSTFLIQHAVWSTEEFGIDAWRVDTYKYCEEKFLNDINSALMQEFPRLTIYGEASVNSITGNAYFTANNIHAPFAHNANGVLDFQTSFTLMAAMNEPFGWTNGVNRLYMTLAQDLLYKNPMNNCIFLDNHDLDRIFSIADENWGKLRMAINWLYTLRGVPQVYYGTEVLMKNRKTTTDALVREDFPGGWPTDDPAKNLFTEQGRSELQKVAFNYISKLGQFRLSSSAIGSGKMMQFIPKDGVYVYFRYDDKQTVMVIANTGDKPVTLDWSRFAERTAGYSKLKEVVQGAVIPMEGYVIPPGKSNVFELQR